MYYFMIFIVGLLIGSFLNVCIYRIPREESIVYPSSHCPDCGSSLRPVDLIPVVSYMTSRGNCRYCNAHISLRYPLVELINAGLYLILYLQFGLSLQFFAHGVLVSILLAITFIDYDHQIIPDGMIILIIVAGLFYKIAYMVLYRGSFPLLSSIGGLLLGGVFFLVVAILSNGGMGGGDIKLMGALGLWLGWQSTLLMMLLSFFIGGVLSVMLLLLKRKGRKEAIPFGPFIAIATFITICWSQEIVTWYVEMFF
ncbi:type 4 prepilin peptidase 1 . Aspartic peptidase. MEROPS family A24A [Natronincola peptidivorans]|uniref:Prepilin leader peptidase/N-methyltransferase n=1 Tax=Natronincola peptidivorans TaxID=426128 RepID=A0A1H9YQJ4_9FIRM|nr:A24 family peptidase [Natronincola peptidivorans]SES71383.1 type 4 prepilin peptidase 1 . Aspartic peptidase. MEROPS family A24A [Natronincola peptidivorans]